MKPIVLAACLAAVVLVIPRPAAAQWTCLNCTNEFTEIAREARRVVEVGRQLQAAHQQYQQLQMAYQAVTGVRDLGSAVGALGVLGIRNPLPINPYAVQGLLNGTGGVGGMTDNLAGLFTGALTQNRVYEAPGMSWVEQEVNRNGSGLAGAQAMALQLYQSAGQRMAHLDSLRAQIGVAEDPAMRESLTAQFAAEGSAIQNQALQAQALNNYMQAQVALGPQRVMERRQMEINDVLADARARGFAP